MKMMEAIHDFAVCLVQEAIRRRMLAFAKTRQQWLEMCRAFAATTEPL